MTDAELLIGTWVLSGEEVRTAEFQADGTLTYSIDIGERKLVMEMTWDLDGGEIVVDQPSALGEGERSAYLLIDDDTLVMNHGGESFTYLRR